MVQHEVERQQPPSDDLNGGLPAVTDVGNVQGAVEGLAEDSANAPAVGDYFFRQGPAAPPDLEQSQDKAVGCGFGESKESLYLVAGEKSRVETYQSDPLRFVPGEAKRPQEFFPAL